MTQSPDAAPSKDQRRLDQLRALLEEARPELYRMEADHEATRLYEPETGALIAIFPHAAAQIDREMALRAIADLGWLLQLYTTVAARLRRIAENARRDAEARAAAQAKTDLAQRCAIETAKPPFIAFLRARHGLEDTAQLRIDTRVRSLLAIKSRSELNTDPEAAERWKSLWAEFQQWRKT